MDQVGKIIKNRKLMNNVINVNVNNSNNDNNVTSKGEKYALDRSVFTPNTEETQLAEEIAISFNDLQNYAFYRHVTKQLGTSGAYTLWQSVLEEIEEKRGSRFEIRSPKKYFVWKFRKGFR